MAQDLTQVVTRLQESVAFFRIDLAGLPESRPEPGAPAPHVPHATLRRPELHSEDARPPADDPAPLTPRPEIRRVVG